MESVSELFAVDNAHSRHSPLQAQKRHRDVAASRVGDSRLEVHLQNIYMEVVEAEKQKQRAHEDEWEEALEVSTEGGWPGQMPVHVPSLRMLPGRGVATSRVYHTFAVGSEDCRTKNQTSAWC